MTRTEILIALEEHRISHVAAEYLLAQVTQSSPEDADAAPPMTLVEAARVATGARSNREGWLR